MYHSHDVNLLNHNADALGDSEWFYHLSSGMNPDGRSVTGMGSTVSYQDSGVGHANGTYRCVQGAVHIQRLSGSLGKMSSEHREATTPSVGHTRPGYGL